jgi:phosphatidylglycerol lysyltransferase
LHTFLLFKESGLFPHTGFARDFQKLNYILGAVSWLVLIFSFYKTSSFIEKNDAEDLVNGYGASSLDYFKLA